MTDSHIDGRRAACLVTSKLLAILLVLLSRAICPAQSTAKPAPAIEWSNELNQYPGLIPELIHLFDRLEHDVQFPPARAQSHILPLLSQSTVFYAAFPNYGDASRQALEIFHQELEESPVLRDWWQHVNAAGTGNVEDFLEKFYDVSQYLGNEIVIAGSGKGTEPAIVFVAEVRKPGLKAFLEQLMTQFPATPRPAFRVLNTQDLALAKDVPGQQPVILVRSDLVIGAGSVATLRSFNADLSPSNLTRLSSTLFGQRVAQAYEGGLNIVGAADLHSILKLVSEANKDKQVTLERTGFSEMKYAVWERKAVGGRDISQAELSFNGPRRGVASWLAAPHRLGSLEFLSPQSLFAASVALASPAQIFDDIQAVASASASPSNSNPLMTAAAMGQMLGINVKDDLLNLLTGEIAVAVDSATDSAPVWQVVLGVEDPSHLQRTLSTLLAASHMQPERSEEGGRTYYSVAAPSATKPVEIGYTFVDGYLVVGSSHEVVREAVRRHRSGGSLGKSESFLASLPPGHPAGVSALLYEDPSAMMAMTLAQAAPELRASLSPTLERKPPLLVCAYGDEDAIREATTSAVFDPAAMLVVAAVAIPNLLRAKIAANDASAVGTLRTLNTAEISYSAAYPQRGFAPTLAVLGADPTQREAVNANHAGLIDATLGNPSCTSAWCVKNGYRFRVTAECRQRMCGEFVAVATPVSTTTGARNFCSTSDGVIRFRLGAPLMTPVTALECKGWQSLDER